ncbi:MAG: thioesterase family protein [Desulfobacterales bacterium]|nr:thioesterase family protein [Desulfobacterales bacterium]
MTGPDEALELPYSEGLTPAFTRHFAYRWALGDLPFSGKGGHEIGGWIQFRERTDCLSEEWLVALADAWPIPQYRSIVSSFKVQSMAAQPVFKRSQRACWPQLTFCLFGVKSLSSLMLGGTMADTEKCSKCGDNKAPRKCYECGHQWDACACHVLPDSEGKESHPVQSVPICPKCESLAVSQ